MSVYDASAVKRRRATQEEMEARAGFLIDYAHRHGPVSVRGLYYQAEVASVPGIDKLETSYAKVQRQVLKLRRASRLNYDAISDSTRWMRKPNSYNGIEAAMFDAARSYRRNMWSQSNERVEIWLEKDALAGVVFPVTSEFDVPLMVSRGYTSETFAYNSVAAYSGTNSRLHIYSLYDFDRSGESAAISLREKVERFAGEMNVDVSFHVLGLTRSQVENMNLPTRPSKAKTPTDKAWAEVQPWSAELDAIPPDDLRQMVRVAIEQHLPADELARLQQIEEQERMTALELAENWGDAA